MFEENIIKLIKTIILFSRPWVKLAMCNKYMMMVTSKLLYAIHRGHITHEQLPY